jgi:putative membrane protein
VEQLDAFVLTFLYFVAAVAVVVIGVFIFELITTKYKDWQEIADGNHAVALSVGGKIIGICIVLAFSIFENAQIWSTVLWGGYGVILQMIAYYLFETFTKFSVETKLKERNTAVGIVSCCISVGLGLVIGASIT